MKKTISILLLFILHAATVFCQDNNYGVKGFNPKTFPVKDSMPVTYNGLQAGYNIESETEKTVGKKGDFSRFKIKFWLTNTGTEAKIVYRNMDFFGHSGPINNSIALFKCLNATGARLTNKMATMEMQPCKIQATVEEKECNTDKVKLVTKLADIGYWIKPGETISKTYPMIVPLNEKPDVTITFYAEVGNQTGTFITQSSQQQVLQNFARIRNFANNTFLNNQNGPLASSAIENGWWSADWEIVPVEGSNNFQIKNRWKGTYICSSCNGMLTDNAGNPAAMWMIQETSSPNIFYIKNVADNARLFVENGTLKTSSSFISSDALSKWIIDK